MLRSSCTIIIRYGPVILLSLIEETKVMDAFSKQILPQDRFCKESLPHDKFFFLRAVIILTLVEATEFIDVFAKLNQCFK